MTQPRRKVCFVTIGATAPFDLLLSRVLDQPFLEALKKASYTTLLIQYGKEGKAIFDTFDTNHPVGSPGRFDLEILGFDFKQDGLQKEMRSTKADDTRNVTEGMILSHAGTPIQMHFSSPCSCAKFFAGSGSIMEALRLGVPLVVVPNPDLQDNHQEDLARQIARNGWAVAGKLE